MRKALLLGVLAAATIVTASLASPEPLPITSLSGAAEMMQRTAMSLSLNFLWLITAVLLTLVSPRDIRYSSIEVRVSPLYCAIVGLVALTSFVLTAVLVNSFTFGLPLLIALGVFAVFTKIYGMIAVFHAIGTLVGGARTIDQLMRKRWLRGDIALVVLGLLVLGSIRLIPVVGPIAWGVASVFGVGVALATKFGRREPWFLTWRPAEVRTR